MSSNRRRLPASAVQPRDSYVVDVGELGAHGIDPRREGLMGSLTLKNRPTLPLAMASDRSLSSASGSSRAPHESPCLAMAGAGSSTTIQRLLPIRSARPRERFSDLLTMIDGKSMATLSYKRCLPFDLRARLRAQHSSLLVELESCVT